jgi:hypothetical protein
MAAASDHQLAADATRYLTPQGPSPSTGVGENRWESRSDSRPPPALRIPVAEDLGSTCHQRADSPFLLCSPLVPIVIRMHIYLVANRAPLLPSGEPLYFQWEAIIRSPMAAPLVSKRNGERLAPLAISLNLALASDGYSRRTAKANLVHSEGTRVYNGAHPGDQNKIPAKTRLGTKIAVGDGNGSA